MNEGLAQLEPMATGLALLIRLHDREADEQLLEGLRAADAPGLFEALIGGAAPEALAAALAELPAPVDGAILDALAAEFADVYLTHALRIAPTGSVWLTEEHLERQGPMFAVRQWYAHYHLAVPEWRLRSDDHIVHELQFIEHLLRLGTIDSARDAARFMDRHVLVWVPQFCALMAERCQQPLLVATARLTGGYLEALRDALEEMVGEPRWQPGADAAVATYGLRELEEDVAYMPGLTESW